MSKVKPLSDWDAQSPVVGVAWFSRLDGRYLIEVVSDDDIYRGRLRVFDKEDKFKLLLDEPTGISFGAPFGADVADVERWQRRVMEVIDGKEN